MWKDERKLPEKSKVCFLGIQGGHYKRKTGSMEVITFHPLLTALVSNFLLVSAKLWGGKALGVRHSVFPT